MIGEATLRGSGTSLRLQVHGASERPGLLAATVWVSRTLRSARAEQANQYEASCFALIPSTDLVHFTAELAVLDRELNGTAVLCRNPDYFQARISISRGKGTMDVAVVQAGIEFGLKEVRLDQTHIAASLGEFQKLSAAAANLTG